MRNLLSSDHLASAQRRLDKLFGVSAREVGIRLASDATRALKNQNILNALNQLGADLKIYIDTFSDDEFMKYEIECIVLLMFLTNFSCHGPIDDQNLRDLVLDAFHQEMYSYLKEAGLSEGALNDFEGRLAAKYKRYYELFNKVASKEIGAEVVGNEMLKNLLPSKFHNNVFLVTILVTLAADHIKNLKTLLKEQEITLDNPLNPGVSG